MRATDFMAPKVQDGSAGALDVTIESTSSGKDASAALYKEVLDGQSAAQLDRTAHTKDVRDSHASHAQMAWGSAFGSFAKFAATSEYFRPRHEAPRHEGPRPVPPRPSDNVPDLTGGDRRQPAPQVSKRGDDYGLPAYTRPLPDSGRRQQGSGLPQRNRMPDRYEPGPAYPPAEGDRVGDRPRVTVRDGGDNGLPARQPGRHPGGQEFFRTALGATNNAEVNGVMGPEREKAILQQIENGNIPDFMRRFKTISVRDRNGNHAELKVMPDYLAIGTNEDYVRVPVTPLLAKAIADKYGLGMPTKKVVDDIYQQADVRLAARGLVQDRSGRDQKFMKGNGFYLYHNQLIEKQLNGRGNGDLVAGHKKDLIVSRYLENHPGGLDFYGLFDGKGTPIQKSPAHENTYVDYSHGIRFVSQDVMVNGRPMRYDDVLADPNLAGLVSYEGPVRTARIYKRPNDHQQQYAEIVAAGNNNRGYA